MNKQVLQKIAIYLLALAGGILLTLAFDGGEMSGYVYALVPLMSGLFYVFMEVRK